MQYLFFGKNAFFFLNYPKYGSYCFAQDDFNWLLSSDMSLPALW